jgi:hypothetical protein
MHAEMGLCLSSLRGSGFLYARRRARRGTLTVEDCEMTLRPINIARLAAVTAAFALTILTATVASAATINVTSSADNQSQDGQCTFREALDALNFGQAIDTCAAGNGSNDTINLGTRSISLTILSSSIPLVIKKNVTIEGNGHILTSFNAGGRAIRIQIGDSANAPTNVKIRNLTFTGSSTQAFYAAKGTVDLSNMKISNTGDDLSGSGALLVAAGAKLNISDSEMTSCRGFSAAFLNNAGTAGIYRTALLGGLGSHAMVLNTGALFVDNSTFGKNESRTEGVITSSGTQVNVSGTTIAYNKAGTSTCSSGGCAALMNIGTGPFTVSYSIIAMNTSPAPTNEKVCKKTSTGGFTSGGNNIFGEFANTGCPSGANDQRIDPKLLSTTSNGQANWPVDRGGIGRVYMPDTNSPALNRLNNPGIGFCTASDQRGVLKGRSGSTTCDIGAAERSNVLMVVNTAGTTNELQWDAAMKVNFENAGFTVTTKDDDVAVASDANNKHLVYLSESVDSNKVTNKFKDVAQVVIVNEPSLYPHMRMTLGTQDTDFGDLAGQTTFTIDDIRISNAMGIGGQAAITYQPFDIGVVFGWGLPKNEGFKIAKIAGSSTRAAIFAYNRGFLMAGTPDFVAPSYRAGFMIQPPGVGFADNGNFMRNIVTYFGAQLP